VYPLYQIIRTLVLCEIVLSVTAHLPYGTASMVINGDGINGGYYRHRYRHRYPRRCLHRYHYANSSTTIIAVYIVPVPAAMQR